MSSDNANPLEDLGNFLLQTSTGGLIGYDGKLKAGVTGKAAIEGTKEITGAKAAEDANAMAKEQFNESKIKAEEDRKNAITAKANTQIAASNAAGSARSTTNTTKKGVAPIGDTKDFLGL